MVDKDKGLSGAGPGTGLGPGVNSYKTLEKALIGRVTLNVELVSETSWRLFCDSRIAYRVLTNRRAVFSPSPGLFKCAAAPLRNLPCPGPATHELTVVASVSGFEIYR